MTFLLLTSGLVTLLLVACSLYVPRKKFGLLRPVLVVLSFSPMVWVFTHMGPKELVDPVALQKAYEAEFGSLPPPDVQEMRGRELSIVGNSSTVWLTFHAAPPTVDLLLKRFQLSDERGFVKVSGGANTPGWWAPPPESTVSFYRAREWNPRFTDSEAVLSYDRSKRIVFFCHRGSN